MSNPYVGEIRMFGGNFAPAGWAMCQGQLIPISENDTLFTLIGTTYGGDGQENFALPDLQGRAPLHQGSNFVIGEVAGSEFITLTTNQIPLHNHAAVSSGQAGNSSTPNGTLLADEGPAGISNVFAYAPYDSANQTALAGSAVQPQGGNQPHENRQPLLCVSFIISLFGVFPSQN